MIFIINFFLYGLENTFKLLVFSYFRERKNSPIYIYFPYIPLMALYYGYFLRFIRSKAYIQEIFFKTSYKDPWNPEKTSKQARALKI